MSLVLLFPAAAAPPPPPPPPIVYALTVAGVSKSIRRNTLRISESVNARNTFACEIVSTDGTYRPAIGAEVILTEDGTRIFGGNIDVPAEAGLRTSGGTGHSTLIRAVGFAAIADRRSVTATIASGSLKAGLQYLVTNYLSAHGVSLDPAQVTGPTLPQLVYDNRLVSAVLDEFSALTGGQYLWELDYSKVLRMYQVGTVAAPYSIIPASDDHALGDITVESSQVDYANRVIVLAGTGQREVTDTFTGNGVATSFALSYQFVFDRGYVINGGVYETMGPSGATWRYQPSNNTLERPAGAPANGNVITFTYTAQFPYKAQADNTTEQGTRGIWEKILTLPDVFEKPVADNLASAYLTRATTTYVTAGYRTKKIGLKPGMTQTITVPGRNLSGTYLVTDVETSELSQNTLTRAVKATSATTYPGSWRDEWRQIGGGGGSSASASTITLIQNSGVQFGGGFVDLTFPNSHTIRLKSDTNAGGGAAAFVIDDRSNVTALGVDQLVYVRETSIGTNPGRYRLFPKSTVEWHIGGSALGNYVWQILTKDISAYNGYKERGRSAYVGEWTAVAFSASNFTASGAMTWTVEAADQVTYAYTLIGKTMSVGFSIAASTVGGTVSTDLQIAIPGGVTAAKQMGGGGLDLSDNGARSVGSWVVTAGGSVVILRKGDLSNWTLSTNNTAVTGVVTFEIN